MISPIADSINFRTLEAFDTTLRAWTPLITMSVGLMLYSRMSVKVPMVTSTIVCKHGSIELSHL